MTTHDIFFDYDDTDYTARCEVVPAEGGTDSPFVAAHLEVLDVLDSAGRSVDDDDLWETARAVARRAC
jgi:hypothetical protein